MVEETPTKAESEEKEPEVKEKAAYGSKKVVVGDQTFYMDGYLRSNLDIIKQKVCEEDFDCVYVVDGYERFGKSTLVQQVSKYVDPTFSIDRMCFNASEFTAAVRKAEKNQAVVYDEAITGLSARTALGVINTALVKMLAQIGQKNLFVGIVIPAFFDLDKYVCLWRSMFLLHVYVGANMERGFFSFYNRERKKDLYIMGKKTYSYTSYRVKPNFIGRFTGYSTLNDTEYRLKKLKSIEKKEFDITGLSRRLTGQRNALIYALNQYHSWNNDDIAKFLTDYAQNPIKSHSIAYILRQFARERGVEGSEMGQHSIYRLKEEKKDLEREEGGKE